jgi:hypothetical protein
MSALHEILSTSTFAAMTVVRLHSGMSNEVVGALPSW